MANTEMCSTCRFWQTFTNNAEAGTCQALGAVLWPKSGNITWRNRGISVRDGVVQSDVAIVSAGRLPPSDSDIVGRIVLGVAGIRTAADFGCVLHEPRD